MANRADLQMTGDALDDLAKILIASRAQRNQEARDQGRDQLEKAMLDLRRQEGADQSATRAEEFKSRRAHEQRTEEYQKKLLANSQTQSAIKQLNDAYSSLQNAVNNGSMTPAEASTRAKDIQSKIQAGPDLAWQNSHFGLIGTDFKKASNGEFIEDPTTGERFFRPSGSHQTLRSGNRNPNVVWEEDPISGQFRMKRLTTKGGKPGEDMMNDLLGGGGGAAQNDPVQQRINQIDQEIRNHQMEQARGDQRTGILNWQSRADAIKALQDEKAKLSPLLGPAKAPGAALPPPAAPSQAVTAPLTAPPGLDDGNTTMLPPSVPTQAPATGGPQQFGSEQEARASGKKTGDVIQLWDPGQKRYRPFQLE